MAINNAQLTVALDKIVTGAGIGIDCAQATYAPDWIEVYYGTNKDVQAVYNTDYTVSVAGDYNSHTVTPTAGFITKLNNLGQGNNIRIIRNSPSANDITPTDTFVRAKLEFEFNTLSMRVAELHYLIDNIEAGGGTPGPGLGDVIGGNVSVDDNLPMYSGVDGKHIEDSGIPKADVFRKSVGGTVDADVILRNQAAGARNFEIDALAGSSRRFRFRSGGLLRWEFSVGSQAEAGGNVGSPFSFNRYDDAGSYIDTPWFIDRSTGNVLTLNRQQFTDTAFYATATGGVPHFNFDTNDHIEYDRAANQFKYTIANTLAYVVDATGIKRIASDANFVIDKSGSNPEIIVDAGDNITYDRASNEFRFTIGGGVKHTLGNGYAFFFGKPYCFDAINVDPGSGDPGSPENGDIWSTNTAFYMRTSGQTGVVPHEQFMLLGADYVLTSQTAAQKAFNNPANGAFNAKAATSYEFEGVIMLSGMSASSGTFGFALGGTATLTSIQWGASAMKSVLATAAAASVTENITAANATLIAANTNTDGSVRVKGVVRVNAAGTLIPQVSLGVAAAATVKIGSYFKFRTIGSNVIASQGDFS